LISETDPDYPPLCYACDEANRQGSLAIWCHNGAGMEAPVAAILGKLDAFNLFDPYWVMPEEYTVWYHLLNCGIKLPASTGSDWYICSNNRVYVQTDGPFSYESWLDGLQAGRSFITNGPALFIRVNDSRPGDTIVGEKGDRLEIELSWQSHYPIQTVELISNGRAVNTQSFFSESREGRCRIPFIAEEDGWLAARVSSTHRDSFYQPIFAHTSPIWLRVDNPPAVRHSSANFFIKSLDESVDWVHRSGKFEHKQQRVEVVDLFKLARTAFQHLLTQ
jgi:hypothetical protein